MSQETENQAMGAAIIGNAVLMFVYKDGATGLIKVMKRVANNGMKKLLKCVEDTKVKDVEDAEDYANIIQELAKTDREFYELIMFLGYCGRWAIEEWAMEGWGEEESF